MEKEIFLIEDEESLINLYKEVFEGFNFKIISEKSGRRALEKLKKRKVKPNLIILDLVLPDLPGAFLLKEIRNDAKLSKIPLIILTNYSDKKLEEKAKKWGILYLVKTNFTPTQLAKLIQEKLKEKKEDS